MTILYAFLWFAGIALVLGAMLAAASIVFAVKVDPRVSEINEILPGANCGGCGFTGCAACAEAIVKGDAKISACPVGGQSAADKIASVMGVSAEKVTRMRAQVMCTGHTGNAKQKYIYEGPHDCAAAMRLGGGPKECPNGCIGFGTCEMLCPEGAISVENGIASVRAEKCLGCGICVDACPKHIIKLIPFDAPVFVGCSSLDKGALTRSYCEVGCIGCKLCTKVCDSAAITVNGAIASINYETCTHCGKCAEKCPRGIIFFDKNKVVIAPAQEPSPEEPAAETAAETPAELDVTHVSDMPAAASDAPIPAQQNDAAPIAEDTPGEEAVTQAPAEEVSAAAEPTEVPVDDSAKTE